MLNAPFPALAQAGDQIYRIPTFFAPVFLALLVIGGLAWLVAALLGFARARAFGPSTRWFALSAACLIVYHVQLFVIGFVISQRDNETALGIGAFFNLFIVLGGIFAIVGFVQLNKGDE